MKRLLVALAAAASLGPRAEPPDALLAAMAQPWTGDLDGMIERRGPRAGRCFAHAVLDRPRPPERRRVRAAHEVRGGC